MFDHKLARGIISVLKFAIRRLPNLILVLIFLLVVILHFNPNFPRGAILFPKSHDRTIILYWLGLLISSGPERLLVYHLSDSRLYRHLLLLTLLLCFLETVIVAFFLNDAN